MKQSGRKLILWGGSAVVLLGGLLVALSWRSRPIPLAEQGPDRSAGVAQVQTMFGANARTAFRDVWYVQQPETTEGTPIYLRFTFRDRPELVRLMTAWQTPMYPSDSSTSCSGDTPPAWWSAPARVEVFRWGDYQVCIDEVEKRAYLYGLRR